MVTRQQYADLALALPEATAGSHFGQPDFRVRGKIFCGLERTGERGSLKIRKDVQALLVEARPEAFIPCAGAWGDAGWTYVDLPRASLVELRDLIEDAWRQVAPKRLADQHTASTDGDALVLTVRATPARPQARRASATTAPKKKRSGRTTAAKKLAARPRQRRAT
ncbi:MAG TPA: MmcQ/YjbR family DNA-binding protein [Polyangiaceae bacterium]|jgi:hypothetical protein|nr:MmcQ/YjbR family DNA-binding protein [Polyangiaceae bacterium]